MAENAETERFDSIKLQQSSNLSRFISWEDIRVKLFLDKNACFFLQMLEKITC